MFFPNFDYTKITHFDNPLWDSMNRMFKFTLPNLSKTTLRNFLNTVIKHLRTIYGICNDSKTPSYHCLLDTCACNSIILGGSARHKPNICLISKATLDKLKADDKLQWPLVEALVEVTTSSVKVFNTLHNHWKSGLIFESQPWCHFTISLAFYGPVSKVGVPSLMWPCRCCLCRTF